MVWHSEDIGHSTVTIHINASVWGMGIWILSEKKEYQCPLLHEALNGAICVFEVLAVCSAVHLVVGLRHLTCLHIVTDNTNTFNIFRSLSVLPDYNPILMLAVNILLKHKIDLCVVVYILGVQNAVVDALS